MAASLEITTTQLFSRSALAALWNKRTEFDNSTKSLLDDIYLSRKVGKIQGQQEVVYKLSRKRAGQLGYGRLWGSKTALERLQNECRATICRSLYYDLDIVNCQPTIITQFVKNELGIDMPVLYHYVKNREAYLKTLMEVHDMNRDCAKNAVIKVIYGEIPDHKELSELSHEVRNVAKKLAKLSKYGDLFDAIKNEKNIYHSFLSFLAQTEERKCMLAMRDWLMEKGWSVDVLCYDGVMIRRRDDGEVYETMLSELAVYVKEQTGYDIQIKEKEMVGFSDLVIPAEDPAITAYKETKVLFEKDHFYFSPTNTICEVSRAHGIFHYSLDHAMIKFNGMSLPGGKDDDPNLFIKKWIKDGERRTIESLVYKNSDECAANEASLFTGFAFDEMDGDDASAPSLFMDMLRAVCGDNEDVYKYVLNYFAHMLQKPFEIPGTALVFSSKTHGTGKDTVINIMRHIIGRHSKHYCSESQFWNGHDTGKEGAILLHLEEVGSSANKAKKNELKALITADSIDINPKGVKAYDVPNIARIVMTTNEPDPVKIEDSDRRFVIINPSNRLHARGLDWWAATQTQIKSHAFLGTVGRWLTSIDLTGWNPRSLPMTEAKAELAEASKSVELLFLEDYVLGLNGLCEVSPLEIYSEYKKWYKLQEMEPKFMRISAQSLAIHVSRYSSTTINGVLLTKHSDGTRRFYRLTPAA